MMRFAVMTLVSVALMTSVAGQSAAPVERDLAYGADPAQRLDLAVPIGAPGLQPRGFSTIVFVHGGSLTSGDKADADYGKVCDAFPAAGIACANVNYRLLSAAPWPGPAEDVAAAIAWLRDKLPARGGDPQKLFLLGHSSGAMLVALVGSDERFLKQRNLTTGALSGVMPMGSIMWDDDLRQSIERNGLEKIEAAFARDPRGKAFGSLEAYQAQWPINYVRSGLPPFLFLIAESEQINPPILRTNQKFVDEARAKGNQADLRVFAGRTHYSNIRRIHEPGDEVFGAVVTLVRDRSR
jgi:acetyl esterase/lipase